MTQDDHTAINPVSKWIARFAHLVPRQGESGGTVLDLACGSGRNTRYFLGRGYSVVAVDHAVDSMADLAATCGCTILEADLETGGRFPVAGRRFAAVVVTNYLHRPLFNALIDAVEPGGVLIYETFAEGNETLGYPRNPDFLLHAGELLEAVRGRLRVIAYEEGRVDEPRTAVIQRICARREPGGPTAPVRIDPGPSDTV